MPFGFIHNARGNRSSKRLCAMIGFFIPLTLGIIACLYGINHPLGDKAFIIEFIAIYEGGSVVRHAWGQFEEKKSKKGAK